MSLDILEVQPIVKVLYRLANTIPERFTAYWSYQSANLIQSPATRVWLAINDAFGSNLSILDQQKLGPKPTVVLIPAAKAETKTGIVNTKNQSAPGRSGTLVPKEILRPASSTRRKTPLGNFRFSQDVTVKNIHTPTEEITSKAPRPYQAFITIKIPTLEEEGNIGEKFILEYIHAAYKYMWEVDPTMVIYTYPGKIQHSAHVLPYENKHTHVPQSKKHRKMAFTPELKWYTDRVIVHSQMCLYINFFIGHSIPITDLANCDVKYKFENDQMQLIVNDSQAPDAITVIWLAGMDSMTMDCQDLADTLRKNDYYKRLPIHVRVQQLKIRKTDQLYKYGTPEHIRVVMVLCPKHLRKVTVKALRKTFNNEKPKDVQNQPNGTTAKMVEWYGDPRSRNPNKEQFSVAMIAKRHHSCRRNLYHCQNLHCTLELLPQSSLHLVVPLLLRGPRILQKYPLLPSILFCQRQLYLWLYYMFNQLILLEHPG